MAVDSLWLLRRNSFVVGSALPSFQLAVLPGTSDPLSVPTFDPSTFALPQLQYVLVGASTLAFPYFLLCRSLVETSSEREQLAVAALFQV